MKTCIQCQTPFEPSGNAQKKCPACRDAALAPATDNASRRQALADYCTDDPKPVKAPHQQTLDRLSNDSFGRIAGDLMQLAGVRKMHLDYGKYKVTIELQMPCD